MPAPASRRRAALVVALAASAACSSDQFVDPGSAPAARAFGIWNPGPFDSCTKEQHDAYAVLGPDGKVYPTWHPPTGPGAAVASGTSTGGIPHGLGPLRRYRGHAVRRRQRDARHLRSREPRGMRTTSATRSSGRMTSTSSSGVPGSAIFTVTCDVLTKFHQGTHSKDAFTNNVHELVYHIRCDNGGSMGIHHAHRHRPPRRVRPVLRPRRPRPGGRSRARPTRPRAVGSARFPTGPAWRQELLVAEGQNSNFGALHETWETSNSVRRADGHTLAHFNPYFQVRLPSRFHDPALAPVVGAPDRRLLRGHGDRRAGERGPVQPLHRRRADPRRHLRRPALRVQRADHFVDINANNISNSDGPEVWYTDAYGQNGRTQPFPGSVRQRIAQVDNNIGVDVTARPSGMTGTTAAPAFGRRTDRHSEEAAAYARRSSQRTSEMPPGSKRSLVKTWVMVTMR